LADVLALAAGQHGVVTRAQLREVGMTDHAIEYRLRRGRLHPVHRGVYAWAGRSSRGMVSSLLPFSAAGPARR
jgi:hypothetical protein